jgi:glycine cleavage system H protein
MTASTIKGFEVRLERLYDVQHHMWAEVIDENTVRVGMDALGVETSGTLAHVAMFEEGSTVTQGGAFGSMEAEKYVGPLVAPLSGVISAVNEAAHGDPALVHGDPYEDGWLIEMTPSNLVEERANLVEGEGAITERFSQKVTEYRLEGVLAE